MLRSLVNVDPAQDLRSFDEFVERLFGPASRPTVQSLNLPIDVTERDGKLFIKAAVPGVDPNELQVTVENNVLSIRGESRQEASNEHEKVYRREVSYGSFSRSIRLPERLDLNGIEASFDRGMVTISIPRIPEEKPQALRIQVKSNEAKPMEMGSTEENH